MESAREHTEFALKFCRETGLYLIVSFGLYVLGLIYFESGDLNFSEDYLIEAIEVSKNHNQKLFLGMSQIWLGRVLARKDITKRDKAEKQILEGMKVLEACNMRPSVAHGYLFLGELYADLGQKEKALKNLKKAESMYQEMEMSFWPDKVQEVLDRL